MSRPGAAAGPGAAATGRGRGRRVLVLLGRSAGGTGAHVADLVAALPAHGWTPRVATAAGTAARFDLGPHVETAWGRPARLRALAAGADVLHAHGHQAGALAVAVAATLPRRRRPVVVVSWHNAVPARGWRGAVAALVQRAQARGAALVTGASDDLVARARGLGARAELAPVAAPAAALAALAGPPLPDAERRRARAALAAELGLDPAAAWLLTAGRLAPQKDLPTLVAAAARLPAPAAGRLAGHRPQWLVAGEGPPGAAAALERLAAALGAPVRLLGARDDVPALLALADAFVLTSTWEARSLAVQEAMAAGLPVVATAVGGLPGLLAGAGVLVPPGDPAALAAAVGALLADDAARAERAAAGRAVSAALPGPADVVAAWSRTYAALLG